MSSPTPAQRTDFAPDRVPGFADIAVAVLLFAFVAFHIFAMTPFTNNLDDIKYISMWSGGGILLALFALMHLKGLATLPPRIVLVPYLAYLGASLLSVLASAPECRWIGWQIMAIQLANAGYFLVGCHVMRTVLMVRYGLRFWVLVTFLASAFGLFHYAGGMEPIVEAMQAKGDDEGPLYNVLYSFTRGGKHEMISTILNKEFFANFLCLTLPICLAGMVLAMERIVEHATEQVPGERSYRWLAFWLVLAGVDVLLALTCTWLTYSKSGVMVLPFALLFFAFVPLLTRFKLRFLQWQVVLPGMLVVVATVLSFSWYGLETKFKPMKQSIDSRRIIYGGAFGILRDNPVLGGGPGSFRILFPRYRDPNYHVSDISNVTMYAHNTVVHVLAETGALGFASYGAFIFAIYVLGWKAIRKCPYHPLRVATIGYLLGIFMFYVGNLATPMMFWPIGHVVTFVSLGMATGCAVTGLRGNLQPELAAPMARGGLAAWGRMGFAAGAAAFAFYAVTLSRDFFSAAIANNTGVVADNAATEFLGRSVQYRAQARQFDALARTASDAAKKKEYRDQAEDARDLASRFDVRGRTLLAGASRDFDDAQALYPGFVTSYYKQAHTYSLMGDQEKALESYLRMQKFNPDYAEVHYNLAVIYYNLAVGTKDKASQKKGDVAKLRSQAIEYFDKAIESAERAAKMSAKITARELRAKILDEAAQFLGVESPRYADLMRRAAKGYEEARDLPFSTVILDSEQLGREREDKETSVRRAPLAYEAIEDWKAAGDAYAKAYDLNRGESALLRRALHSYVKAGANEDAMALVGKVLERNPAKAEVLLLKAELAMDIARDDAAKREAREEAAVLVEIDRDRKGFLSPTQLQRARRIMSGERAEDS